MLNKIILITFILSFSNVVTAGWNWTPDGGSWQGTAPSCDAECSSSQFAYCVAMNVPGCAYAPSVTTPSVSDFGHDCLSGRKAFCVNIAGYPQVTDYNRLNALGSWKGTAPACDGDCGANEFALCRSADGDSCAYTSGIDASKLNGHGHDCSSGRKAFCVNIDYLSGPPPASME